MSLELNSNLKMHLYRYKKSFYDFFFAWSSRVYRQAPDTIVLYNEQVAHDNNQQTAICSRSIRWARNISRNLRAQWRLSNIFYESFVLLLSFLIILLSNGANTTHSRCICSISFRSVLGVKYEEEEMFDRKCKEKNEMKNRTKILKG